MKKYIATFCLLLFFVNLDIHSQEILLTEVMANPKVLSDQQGEYLEVVLWNPSSNPAVNLSPYIVYKQDTLTLPKSGAWPPSKTWWICRNSSLSSKCNAVWESLNLTNRDSLYFTTCYGNRCLSFVAPPAKEGISWENNFNVSNHSSSWTLSTSTISATNPFTI